MEIFADLNCYVSSDGTGALAKDLAVKANVQSDPARDDELAVSAEIDGTAGEAARPRGGQVQWCGFEIYVDGVMVKRSVLDSEISVTRSYDERLQSASFTVHLNTPTGPLGSGFHCNIPPTRGKEIDIYGVYLTSTGKHLVPLITGGIAHSSSRRGTNGGFFESINVVDRGGRFDQKLVDAVFPPGHGLTRDRVVEKCARQAGETQFRMEQGQVMLKELQLVDAGFIEPCQELLDTENRRLLWNDQGELSNPQVGRPRSNEAVAWTFDERDMIASTDVSVDFKADAITRVTATGTAQESIEQCGDVVITTRIEVKDIEAPETMPYIQQAGGTFSANAAHPIADYATPQTIEVQVVTRIERCDVEIYQRHETYQFYNPESARYWWDSINDEWGHVGFYVAVPDDEDDDEAAFAFAIPQWGLVAVDEVWTCYFQVGYRGSEVGIPGYPLGVSVRVGGALVGTEYPVADFTPTRHAGLDADTGLLVDVGYPEKEGFANHKLATFSRAHRMGFYRTAIKRRALSPYPLTPFEEIEPFDGLAAAYVTGAKAGISTGSAVSYFSSAANATSGEQLIVSEEVLEVFHANSKHYMVGKDTVRWGVGAKRGNGEPRYWFGPDYVSMEATESFRMLRIESEVYEAVGDESHNIYRTNTDELEGEPDRAASEFGVEGYLPAIDLLPQPEVDPGLYNSEEEQLAIQAATTRQKTKEIKVEVIASDLETCGHEVAVQVVDFPWAESEDELEFMALAMIDESVAADVRLTLAGANFFVREGQLVLARFRPIDLDNTIRVRQVTWSGGGDRPIITTIDGKLYHG